MAKKVNDINLFSAASKADKKIQTGVSKSFLPVFGVIVVLVAVIGYTFMLYTETTTLQAEKDSYTELNNYETTINVLMNKISEDQAYLTQIQKDIDAAYSIKEFAQNNSILYPGLTKTQQAIVFQKTYNDNGVDKLGCVPDEAIIDATLQIGVERYFTDGIRSFDIYRDDVGVTESVIFPKGYIIIMFQSATDDLNIATDYVSNIIGRAPMVFASEDADAALTQASFETGYVSKPDSENPNANFKYYVKCRLKSIVEILMEDEYMVNYASVSSLKFTGSAVTMELETHTIPIYELARYLDSLGLFTKILYNKENATPSGDIMIYDGSLICGLTDGGIEE